MRRVCSHRSAAWPHQANEVCAPGNQRLAILGSSITLVYHISGPGRLVQPRRGALTCVSPRQAWALVLACSISRCPRCLAYYLCFRFVLACLFYTHSSCSVLLVRLNVLDLDMTQVQAIIPIARALNMQGFLDMTQRELGGLPLAASDYAQKGGMHYGKHAKTLFLRCGDRASLVFAGDPCFCCSVRLLFFWLFLFTSVCSL